LNPSPTVFPRIGVVVLNWNGWQDTIPCLESLFSSDYPAFKVAVCDNGSTDDSVARLQSWASQRISPETLSGDGASLGVRSRVAPLPFETCDVSADGHVDMTGKFSEASLFILKSSFNGGYAVGMNIGWRFFARSIGVDYILIANNDLVFEPDTLRILARHLTVLGTACAAVGPKVLDYKDGSDWQRPERYKPQIWSWLFRGFAFKQIRKGKKTWLYRLFWYDREVPGQVYMLPGSCFLTRVDALEKVEGFDEGTFLFWEEGIIAERWRKHGMLKWHVPEARVYHKWSKSIQGNDWRYLVPTTLYYFRTYRNAGPVAIFLLKCTLTLQVLIRSAFSFRGEGSVSIREHIKLVWNA
jgi:GT2 family glycosyltransferase